MPHPVDLVVRPTNTGIMAPTRLDAQLEQKLAPEGAKGESGARISPRG
jgi:hypothetical protein